MYTKWAFGEIRSSESCEKLAPVKCYMRYMVKVAFRDVYYERVRPKFPISAAARLHE